MGSKSKIPPGLDAVSIKNTALLYSNSVKLICGSFRKNAVPVSKDLSGAFKVTLPPGVAIKNVFFLHDPNGRVRIEVEFNPVDTGAYAHSVRYEGELVMSGTAWVCASERERDVVAGLISGIRVECGGGENKATYAPGGVAGPTQRMLPAHIAVETVPQKYSALRCAVRLPVSFDRDYAKSGVANAFVESVVARTVLTFNEGGKLLRQEELAKIEPGKTTEVAKVPKGVAKAASISVERAGTTDALAEWEVSVVPGAAASVTYALTHDATPIATGGIFIGPTPTLLVTCSGRDCAGSVAKAREAFIAQNKPKFTGSTVDRKVAGGSSGFTEADLTFVESACHESGVRRVIVLDHAPCTVNKYSNVDRAGKHELSLKRVCDDIELQVGITAEGHFLCQDGTPSEMQDYLRCGAVMQGDNNVLCAFPKDAASPPEGAIGLVTSALGGTGTTKEVVVKSLLASAHRAYAVSVAEVLAELLTTARALCMNNRASPLAYALLCLQHRPGEMASGVLPPFGTFVVMPPSGRTIQVAVTTVQKRVVTITVQVTEAPPEPVSPVLPPSKNVELGGREWMKDVGLAWIQRAGDNGDGEPSSAVRRLEWADTFERWSRLCKKKVPAWCYYKFDASNGDVLFNEHALAHLAIAGWRLPTMQEQEAAIDEAENVKSLMSMLGMTGGHIRQTNGTLAFHGTTYLWGARLAEEGEDQGRGCIDLDNMKADVWTRQRLDTEMPGFPVRLVVDVVDDASAEQAEQAKQQAKQQQAEQLARAVVSAVHFESPIPPPTDATAAIAAICHFTDVARVFRLATYDTLRIAMDTAHFERALQYEDSLPAYVVARYEQEVAELWGSGTEATRALSAYHKGMFGAAFGGVITQVAAGALCLSLRKQWLGALEAQAVEINDKAYRVTRTLSSSGDLVADDASATQAISLGEQMSKALDSYESAAAAELVGPLGTEPTREETENYNRALSAKRNRHAEAKKKKDDTVPAAPAAAELSPVQLDHAGQAVIQAHLLNRDSWRRTKRIMYARDALRANRETLSGAEWSSGKRRPSGSGPVARLGGLKTIIDTIDPPDVTSVLDAAQTIHGFYRIWLHLRCTSRRLQGQYPARAHYALVVYAASVISVITTVLDAVRAKVKADPVAQDLVSSIAYAISYSRSWLLGMRAAYNDAMIFWKTDASYHDDHWPALSEDIGTRELTGWIRHATQVTTDATAAAQFLHKEDDWGEHQLTIDAAKPHIGCDIFGALPETEKELARESRAVGASLAVLRAAADSIDTGGSGGLGGGGGGGGGSGGLGGLGGGGGGGGGEESSSVVGDEDSNDAGSIPPVNNTHELSRRIWQTIRAHELRYDVVGKKLASLRRADVRVGTMQIKGTTVRTFDEIQVTSASWNGAWYSAREFANEKENIYFYFHVGYVSSCGEKPKKGEFEAKCSKFEGAWNGSLKNGAAPVVADVRFQTDAGTAHIKGSEYAVAGGTPRKCVWRSPYLLAVYEDSNWTPISLDAKNQTVKIGRSRIQQPAPSAQEIASACKGKEARRWVGVLMDGTEGQVEVEFENTKIEGDVASVDGVEQGQGTWLWPRAFVYEVGGMHKMVYVDKWHVRTGESKTKPSEGDVKNASTDDAGAWTGVLSDGTEPVTEIGGLRFVKVGAQVWTAGDVALGDDADEVRETTWPDGTTADQARHAWCYYDNDKKNERYGRLYTRKDLYRRTICPRGWRIPQVGDWVALLRACGAVVETETDDDGCVYLTYKSVSNVDKALEELGNGPFKALLGGERWEQNFFGLGHMHRCAALAEFNHDFGYYVTGHIRFSLASWNGVGVSMIRVEDGGNNSVSVRLIAEDVLGGLVCAQVGTQVWTAESLDVDVAGVVRAQEAGEWEAAALDGTPAWCYHAANERNGQRWGRLYNAAALAKISQSQSQGVWMVPTAADWAALYRYYSGADLGNVGGEKADAVRALEAPPFRADLGGKRTANGYEHGEAAFWYASPTGKTGVVKLAPSQKMMLDGGIENAAGYSVRLIKKT